MGKRDNSNKILFSSPERIDDYLKRAGIGKGLITSTVVLLAALFSTERKQVSAASQEDSGRGLPSQGQSLLVTKDCSRNLLDNVCADWIFLK